MNANINLRKTICFLFFFAILSLTTPHICAEDNDYVSYLTSERESFIADGYSFRVIQEQNREVKLISPAFETGQGLFDYSDKNVNLPGKVSFNGTEYTVTGISESVFQMQPFGITLPNTVRFILPYNFNRTEESLNLGEGVEYIMGNCFYAGMYESITLPKSLRILGARCFNDNEFSSLSFSEGLLCIGNDSFCGNSKIEEFKLPATLEEIGDGSFCDNASLTSIELPINIMAAKNCFNFNRSLQRVEIKNRHFIPMFENCFEETDFVHCVLVVPDGCKELYLSYMVEHPENSISKFRQIVEKSQETDAVMSISHEEIPTKVHTDTYTLSGIKTGINRHESGEILILRDSKGARKVLNQ